MMRPLGPVLATALVIGVSAQVPPPPPPPPPPPTLGQPGPPPAADSRPGNGLILGQVIDAGSGRPVPGAIVRLAGGTDRPLPAPVEGVRAGGPGPGLAVLTNSAGSFLFRNLPPGTYTAIVSISGYTTGAFGRRRVDGPGRPIVIGENDRVLDATIRIWKQGAIAGTVTDEAGEPLIGISVAALRRTAAGSRLVPVGLRATTDDRGMFRISNLTPGDYIVVVPTTITSVPIAAADEAMEAMRSPSANVSEGIFQQREDSGAPISFGGGMIVGDHQVTLDPTAGILGQGTLTPLVVGGRFYAYPAAFHGGAAGTAQAAVITLQSGEARTGADIRMRSAATARVSGTVTGAEGPVPNIGVRLVPPEIDDAGLSGFETAVTMTDANGRFTFPGVPAGTYIIRSYRVQRPRPDFSALDNFSVVGGVSSGPVPISPAQQQPVPAFWARSTVTVGGDDVTDLSVTLRSGLRVNGRVEFPDAQGMPNPMPTITVSLQPSDGRLAGQPFLPAGRVDQSGAFTTSGYSSGRYWLNVVTPWADVVLKSIQAGGVNLIERPLELDSADITNVVVTFTHRIAELSGTVTGGGGPNDDVSVVVFPADYQAWFTTGRSPRRSATAPADAKGAYLLRLPPPGDYIVAAVLNGRLAELDLPDYAALARTGTRISVTEGEKKTLALTARAIK